MRKITQEEAEDLEILRKNRAHSAVLGAVYKLKVGEILLVEESEYAHRPGNKGPAMAAYHHARKNGKKFRTRSTRTGGWTVERIE